MNRFYIDLLDRLQDIHEDVSKVLNGLPQEALDWSPGPGMNTVCVIVVHLTGAERYWIGDVVGGDLSGRDRGEEFRAWGWSKEDLKARLEKTLAHTEMVFEKLTLADLEKMCISHRDGREFTAGWSIAHALDHAALHTGHLQLIHQLWDQRQAD